MAETTFTLTYKAHTVEFSNMFNTCVPIKVNGRIHVWDAISDMPQEDWEAICSFINKDSVCLTRETWEKVFRNDEDIKYLTLYE